MDIARRKSILVTHGSERVKSTTLIDVDIHLPPIILCLRMNLVEVFLNYVVLAIVSIFWTTVLLIL